MASTPSTPIPTRIDRSESAVMELVSYLRSEADQAEQKAKSLRAQADHLAASYAITDEQQTRYELGPLEVPPLDEHGFPKYKGRKRGRKPKARKRQSNPHRKKRQHTAYTLFVHERYPQLKDQYPNSLSKDLISRAAKQWAEVPADEKRRWKERAMETHKVEDDQADEVGDEDEYDEDEGDEEEDEEQGEEEQEGKELEEDEDGNEGEDVEDDNDDDSADEEDGQPTAPGAETASRRRTR